MNKNTKKCLIFSIMSGVVLIVYYLSKYRDFERYYINNDKLRYKILLYSKYILLFCFIYNIKHVIVNLFKK